MTRSRDPVILDKISLASVEYEAMRERLGVGGRTAGLSRSLPLWFVIETNRCIKRS